MTLRPQSQPRSKASQLRVRSPAISTSRVSHVMIPLSPRAIARWQAAAADIGAATFFFLCAFLQINDPDPLIWGTMYIGSGFMPSAYGAWSHLRGNGASLPLGAFTAAAALPIALFLQALPSVAITILGGGSDWLDILFSEPFRESGGCAIVLTSLVLRHCYFRAALVVVVFAALIMWRHVLLEHGIRAAPHCRSILV